MITTGGGGHKGPYIHQSICMWSSCTRHMVPCALGPLFHLMPATCQPTACGYRAWGTWCSVRSYASHMLATCLSTACGSSLRSGRITPCSLPAIPWHVHCCVFGPLCRPTHSTVFNAFLNALIQQYYLDFKLHIEVNIVE